MFRKDISLIRLWAFMGLSLNHVFQKYGPYAPDDHFSAELAYRIMALEANGDGS